MQTQLKHYDNKTPVPAIFSNANNDHKKTFTFAHTNMHIYTQVWRRTLRCHNSSFFWVTCISCFYLCRYCCAGGPYVCCGRPWWLELSQHSGTLGPTGQTMELCGQYVDTKEHHGSHSTQWKVSCFIEPIQHPNLLLQCVHLNVEEKSWCLRSNCHLWSYNRH